jgi:hypothetical protein
VGRKYQKPVNLATVPEPEWDAIASCSFDAVWFMGVWERSPVGIEISMRNRGLLEDFRRALADFRRRATSARLIEVDLATIRQSITATHHLLQLLQPQLKDQARRKLRRLRQRLLNIDHELDHLTSK